MAIITVNINEYESIDKANDALQKSTEAMNDSLQRILAKLDNLNGGYNSLTGDAADNLCRAIRSKTELHEKEMAFSRIIENFNENTINTDSIVASNVNDSEEPSILNVLGRYSKLKVFQLFDGLETLVIPVLRDDTI